MVQDAFHQTRFGPRCLDQAVELTTTNGKTGEFYVNNDTKYAKGSAPASLDDLKPGTRVVVEGAMEGTKLTAKSVRLSAGTKKTAAAAPAHKH